MIYLVNGTIQLLNKQGPDALIFVTAHKSFSHERCNAANFLYFLLTYFGDTFVHVLNSCIVEHVALEFPYFFKHVLF